MQRLEVSCAVRLIYTSLGAKGLRMNDALMLKLVQQYTQTDRRRVDRPRKTCTESHSWLQINPGVKSTLSLQLINFSFLFLVFPIIQNPHLRFCYLTRAIFVRQQKNYILKIRCSNMFCNVIFTWGCPRIQTPKRRLIKSDRPNKDQD